jgi:hypothetical protein
VFVEVKIQCPCGARYKFDVEPLHGRMPAPVHCPVCGVEGTVSANAIIQQKLAPPPPQPAPLAEVEIIPPPPRPAQNPALAVPAARAVSTTAQLGGRAMPLPRDPLPVKHPPQLVPGVAGAIIAAAIGGAVWFSLLALTGFELGLIAWAAGAQTGWAARALARGGSARLGWLAAACAVTALGIASGLAVWRVSGAAPPGILLAQAFGGATTVWLLLAAASAGRLASR